MQDIDGLGGWRALLGAVDVGQDGAADLLSDLREQRQPGLHAGPAFAREAGAVGLVEACLEHVLRADLCAGLCHARGDLHRVIPRLQLAGPRDHRQRLHGAAGDLSDLDVAHAEICSRRIEAVIDSIR